MMKFHLVYNVMDDYGSLYWMLIVGLIFIIFVSTTVAYGLNKNILTTRFIDYLNIDEGWKIALMGSIFTGVVLIITTSICISSFVNLREIYKSPALQFVEGRVTDFQPMPYEGHQKECFRVKDVQFEFSDYESGVGGYHQTASHGGAIKANLYVRIAYYSTDYRNIILKLETE